MIERWFALLGVGVIVISIVLGGVAVTAETPKQEVWNPATPELETIAPSDVPGSATVNGIEYDELQDAIDAAEPGDTIEVSGTFEERIDIGTAGVTISDADESQVPSRIDGSGEGTVLEITAPNVTIDGIQVTGSGEERSSEDAGITIDGDGATVNDVRIDDVTFGIWISGAEDVTITNNQISGDPDRSTSLRGNAIHLFDADRAEVRNNSMTDVRDGIYYQWSSHVVATDNKMWNLRYGVHYMYSDHNRLEGNLAFANDVGFALMVSENLSIVDNQAVNNRHGPSQHGILVKDIDDSVIRGNDLVDNGNGLYVYNAHDNLIQDNLVLENSVGIHFTAGSCGETIDRNSFIHNDRPAHVTATAERSTWNGSDVGNYWSDARTIDLDGDGTSDVRYRPAGAVERLIDRQPAVAVFAESPAFDTIRLAESSFPVIAQTGVVDHHPLTDTPHEHWRSYYEHQD